MSRGPLSLFIRRLVALLVLALYGAAVSAQADPPGRVGRLNHAEGTVSFSPAGDNEWTDAVLNRPLTRGDRLWTDRKSRAEIQIGSSAVRLDGQTHIDITALDDRAAQLSLTQGTVYVRVRSLPEGENFEIDTPNLAYRAAYPGDYRIDVDPADGTTRVTIHSGTGAVYGEGGHALPMGGGQQITFRARSLTQVTTQESPPQDAFDRWAAERNRREDQSISARYVPREVVGYQDLDAHGQWKKEPTYGAVWYPQGMPPGWAPYRQGHWEWIAPWGWNWIDDARWGFAPFHYGRWALVDSRWAWVPGRLGLRPIYAPALVAFVGGAGGGVLASVSSRTGVAWFPLAPGEMWQPGFHASAAYVSNVNLNMVPGASDATYAYQRRPEALTAISGDDFHRGRPVGAGWLRVAAHTLTNAGIVPPPPMPERTNMAARDKPAPAKAAPPAPSDVRQVIASAGVAAASGQRDAQAKTEQQAKAPDQAKAAQQAKAAIEQAKLAEQARRAEQVRQIRRAALEQAEAAQQTQLAKQAGLEQQRRLAEQARLSERARRAELARAEKLAQQSKAVRRAQRTEPAGRESVARTAPGRREQQAKRTESNRQASAARTEPTRREQTRNTDRSRTEQVAVRTAQARLEQLARREQQARRVELSRREAQARRDERALAQARRSERLQREALARRDEQAQREAHAQRVEQARRAAERDAQALREQRLEREAQLRREANERELAAREQAQREAWQRQQQTSAEQYRRDQQAWEQQQQRERARSRPDLRDEPRRPPEVWQRGTPILNPGRTS